MAVSKGLIQGERLSGLSVGAGGVVTALAGGRHFCGRVAGLGLTMGAEVRVVQNDGRGPLIVDVRGTRVALGRLEAGNVLVRSPREE